VHAVALTWQQSGWLALALLGGAVVLRYAGSARAAAFAPFLQEAGLLAALYGLWQLAGAQSLLGAQGALARGRWIVHAEQSWHLPSERTVQDAISSHPLIVEACNLYYATMHFAALFALLIWLFVKHHDRYPRLRTTVVLVTAACLLVQMLPVAPPRLLPDLGFVDTAAKYGQSVYGNFGGIGADQLSAMPSVHVAWALLVAIAVISVSSSRWRWWIVAHPVLTVFVVTATANHFWLDGIVAAVLLGAALAVQSLAVRVRAQLRRPRPAPVPEGVVTG
jgi:PAP2 superfamily